MSEIAEAPEYAGLATKWTVAHDLAGSAMPCRLEGEVADLVVLGTIPDAIDGTFYRVMCDPFVPPHPDNVPIDGDGHVSAFRIHRGRVDMKLRYVETERYKLERAANRRLFGLYRNPFTHHPCVRAAVDSTANTNMVYWAGQLLALKEVALPYALDPDTLETRAYDPFGGQVRAKTFTAHPKVDPVSRELVVFGYEATGLGSRDIVVYALDEHGRTRDEQWIQAPWCAFVHDCAITTNFVVLFLWPFEADVARMQAGQHHWAWNYDRPATFIVVPRRPSRGSARLPPGWRPGEYRTYHWKNCMPIHTAGAWEEAASTADGGITIYAESSRVHDNAFPFFPPPDGRPPAPDARADFVRWAFDLSRPDGSALAADPVVVLDVPSEFPRIDERRLGVAYDYVFLNVFLRHKSDGSQNIFHGLNGLARHNTRTGATDYYYAGDDSLVQEPVFVPRSRDAPEADGYVLAMVERRRANRNDLVVLDTRGDFGRPVAVVQLPFHVKAQIHGNWVEAAALPARKSLVREVVAPAKTSGLGALEPL